MNRILIIGTSCSGKTTLGRELSKIYNIKSIDLDDLFWLPEWEQRERKEFHALVHSEIKKDSWVVSGNYPSLKEIIWPKAKTIIWLNYPLRILVYRVFMRSFIRCFTKEKLYGGNVETFKKSFFSSESIILWVLKTYSVRKKEYPLLLKSNIAKNAEVKVFKKPAQLQQYLTSLE